MEYTRVGPGLPPVHGARAGALILGSFPSPKSREQGFFYGHPQNRFWPLLAALTGAPAPAHGDIAAKKRLITETASPSGTSSAAAPSAARRTLPSGMSNQTPSRS